MENERWYLDVEPYWYGFPVKGDYFCYVLYGACGSIRVGNVPRWVEDISKVYTRELKFNLG